MRTISRRQFTRHIGAITGAIAFTPYAVANPHWFSPGLEPQWFNAMDMEIEGKGWSDTRRFFDRLPGKAEGIVREPVWNLSRHSSGMKISFRTNSPAIRVRYKLFLERLAMPHMPATGVSGIDLYGKNEYGIERWVGVNRPGAVEIETDILNDLDGAMREYSMYLPLYNGVDSLEIGILPDHEFEALPKRRDKPMVFYGTSIMHGACASRPGMAFPAILGRRLESPFINLAFSGNGRMDPELGELLAELDASLYAIDCLPNMNPEQVSERTPPLVRQLRKDRPNVPILLVEDRSFTNTPFRPGRKQFHENNRAALRDSYRVLREEGIEDLFYLQGDQLLGLDGEAATDGSHPNDLGMVRYADAYEPVLRRMLNMG